jgi:hypothetical protein
MSTRPSIAAIAVLAVLTSVSFFGPAPLHAQSSAAGRLGLTVSAGTNGIGGSLAWSLTRKINIRGDYHAFTYTDAGTMEEGIGDNGTNVLYEGDLSTGSTSLMIDFFPIDKFLGFTVGAYFYQLDVTTMVRPETSVTIGEKVYSAEKIGRINADVSYDKSVMPYAGIVLGNPIANGSPVKLHLQAGVLMSGAPKIDMRGEGMISATADNQGSLQEALDDFNLLPLVNLGLSIRLFSR